MKQFWNNTKLADSKTDLFEAPKVNLTPLEQGLYQLKWDINKGWFRISYQSYIKNSHAMFQS